VNNVTKDNIEQQRNSFTFEVESTIVTSVLILQQAERTLSFVPTPPIGSESKFPRVR